MSTLTTVFDTKQLKLVLPSLLSQFKGLAKTAFDFFQKALNVLDSTTEHYKSIPEKKRVERVKKEQSKDLGKPKRPLNSFLLYCKARRDELKVQGLSKTYTYK